MNGYCRGEVWIGDAAPIQEPEHRRGSGVPKQKTGPCDAAHIRDLLLKNDFLHICMPSRRSAISSICSLSQQLMLANGHDRPATTFHES
jgi:hypothetical protein